ncbi:thiamine pyrophosphate-binding protein [Amycolatopsis sp. NPDC003861]
MADLVSVLVRELARGGAGLIRHGVDYVAARHEGGAMADACYRATGETAVCATTHGAGLPNTATTLSEAVKHRSSVIVICGDAPTGGPRPFDMNTAGSADAIGARDGAPGPIPGRSSPPARISPGWPPRSGPGRHGTYRRRPGGAAGGRGSASEETAGPVTGNHNRQAITGSACPDFERTFNDRDS